MAIPAFLNFVRQFQSKYTKFNLRGLITKINMSPILISRQNKTMSSPKWRLMCKYHIYICMLSIANACKRYLTHHGWMQTLLNSSIWNIFRLGEISSRVRRKCNHDLRKITLSERKTITVCDNKRVKYDRLFLNVAAYPTPKEKTVVLHPLAWLYVAHYQPNYSPILTSRG